MCRAENQHGNRILHWNGRNAYDVLRVLVRGQ